MADDLGRDGMKNQVKGAAKEAAGKLRKNVGDLTDNRSEEFKGAAKEMQGRVQRKVGEAQSSVDRDRQDREIDREIDRDIDRDLDR